MNKETKEVVVYSCGYCGKLFRKKSDADTCHADRVCESCGVVIGKKNYYTKCESCMANEAIKKERIAFEKAEKMTYEEYVNKFPGHATCIGDRFFWGIEEIEDEYEDSEMPKYVWGTDKRTVELDYDNIIQDFEEECELEDFSVCHSGVTKLRDFLIEWNKEYAQDVYCPSNSIVVML